MPGRTIERWKGIAFTYEGRRIVYARFRMGKPQLWYVIPGDHYGSKQECLDYKNALGVERRRRKHMHQHARNLERLGGENG